MTRRPRTALTQDAHDVAALPNLVSERIVPLLEQSLLLAEDLHGAAVHDVRDPLQRLDVLHRGPLGDPPPEGRRPELARVRKQHAEDDRSGYLWAAYQRRIAETDSSARRTGTGRGDKSAKAEGTYKKSLTAVMNSSGWSAVSGSNEWPRPACPRTSSVVRPLQECMSSSTPSFGPARTRCAIASRVYRVENK